MTKTWDSDLVNRRVEALLKGNSIAGFMTGDWWSLRLVENDYHVLFQDMSSSREEITARALQTADPSLFNCSDPEDIAKAAILSSATRREIKVASVDGSGSLKLLFYGGLDITFRSDVDVVDWQWCISSAPADPYVAQSDVVCFRTGEILIRTSA